MPLTVLLTQRAGDDARARDALAFLSYQDKFLAGSWRFNTYFGRDTLISALLLAPVLEPQAMESAIASVLDRLAPNGEVAHEEDIGEFAVLRNAREGRGRVATPIYDYGMVDDDFLLAPLAARWLLIDERGRARAREFLAGTRRERRTARRRAGAQSHLGGRARGAVCRRSARRESRRHQARPHDRKLARQRTGTRTRSLRLRRECRAGSRRARRSRATARQRPARRIPRRRPTSHADAVRARCARLDGARAALLRGRRSRSAGTRQTSPLTRRRSVWMASARCAAWQTARSHSTRCRWTSKGEPDPDPAFGRGLPAAAHGARRRMSSTRCLDAIMRPFPAGLHDGRGSASWRIPRSRAPNCGGNSAASPITARWSGRGSRRCWPPASSASCGAPICPAAVRTQLRACARAPVDGDRPLRGAAHLGAVVVVVRRRPATAWSRSAGPAPTSDESNAAQLWSTVFLGLTPLPARYQRYFAWKLISLPSSGRASNTPPASAATPKMRELLSVRPSSSDTFVPRSENCQFSPTFAVMPKSQVS